MNDIMSNVQKMVPEKEERVPQLKHVTGTVFLQLPSPKNSTTEQEL